MATWQLWPAGAPHGYTAGTALEYDTIGGDVESPHLQIGHEYWVALPRAENTSDRPLTLLKGEITHVPPGLQITEYRAFSHEETEGHPLGTTPVGGSPGIADLTAMPDHSGKPSQVEAHASGDIYWAARVRVTGEITRALTGCRYFYRQGNVKYQQDLYCVSQLRIGPPLKRE
ncbi:hypothetical protein EV284_0768 [Streptomyces sp. BK022]|uniref:hypothetical protein n=1 Tax=Streptomyces sp. BK022 TaxID=2512123 RepID=UPI0010294C7B|nr:hypothetical protein [Streptomyces sp. BK022]RZU46103.1 hypothetical protein EV284_0768 [Streptomyces sp. BK022]